MYLGGRQQVQFSYEKEPLHWKTLPKSMKRAAKLAVPLNRQALRHTHTLLFKTELNQGIGGGDDLSILLMLSDDETAHIPDFVRKGLTRPEIRAWKVEVPKQKSFSTIGVVGLQAGNAWDLGCLKGRCNRPIAVTEIRTGVRYYGLE